MKTDPNGADQLLLALESLIVFRGLRDDALVILLEQALREALAGKEAAIGTTYSLIGDLMGTKTLHYEKKLDLFQNHMINCLALLESPFSEKAVLNHADNEEAAWTALARNELRLLQGIFSFNLLFFKANLHRYFEKKDLTAHLQALEPVVESERSDPQFFFENLSALKKRLFAACDWAEEMPYLASFYRRVGSGIYGRYWAFYWQDATDKGSLAGVAEPDLVRLENLYGLEDQKAEIIRNTEQFVQGHKANNLLLYGDRGTGKSSTVKGLLHRFGHQGLRLIEVSRHNLLSLQKITDLVRNRAERFIIFIDDLSFEEDETEYKELKALLEGSIAAVPANLVIYATSNRRNLVREFFGDRSADEVNSMDTYQEKLSLADRFGMKLIYPALNQQLFLETVAHLAELEGLSLQQKELKALAVRWALWHNAPSGRTARQFIDDLKGRLALDEKGHLV